MLSAVVFLVSPAHRLASEAIFDAADKGYYGVASALSVTILAIAMAVMATIHLTSGWPGLGARRRRGCRPDVRPI